MVGGKTTILSHIADAFHEIAKIYYTQSYKGLENQYYRIQSAIEIYRSSPYSLVYIRFKHNGANVDYVNIWGKIDENEPARGRHKYGKLFEMNGRVYIKLNLQIRFARMGK